MSAMMYCDFWQELRESWRFLSRNPETIIPALPAAFLMAVANHLVWRRSLTWITAFFQWGVSIALVMLGILLGFVALGFIVGLVWEARYREKADILRAWRILAPRFGEVFLASLILGFLVSFFSVFFVFPGLLLGFLLMFVLPVLIIEREDPFSAIRHSFQLSFENLGECFTFLVIALFFGVVGYLLFWLFEFLPFFGVIINTVVGSGILSYVAVFLTRFYLNIGRL
jgi:MFS family permease